MKSPGVSRGYERGPPRKIGGGPAQLMASAPAENAADWSDERLIEAAQEMVGPLPRNTPKLLEFS